jgi:chromosome segregation ATPase
MAQDMTYAKALNEAKQVIIQQQYRIKSDAEKIKMQQQTILDQSNSLSENERHLQAGAAERQRLTEELSATNSRLNETTTSLGQAEAVVNRQGEKITSLQATISELEQRLSDQGREISQLKSERDELSSKLPTSEDIDALSSMSELLSRRPSSKSSSSGMPQLRLSTDSSSESSSQSEAA